MYALAQLPAEQLAFQIQNGFILLALGMSIVFVFLTILVFTTLGVSKLVRKFEKQQPAQPVAEVASPAAAGVVASDDAEIAVAIAAAMAKSKS